ncbi:uncharacterized protein MYCFIDRAFT_199889 [Pseudocercospora fijiensis CIRAD86]|uniref:Uncharacterized protein n=1 Tax=Pseudocercospora fijiensis (strain CIRAD86) TaxID=383855 RepID=M3ANU3_PSEFD|nr:uncharacterized protein MYCFIDRAFT_199889 [Pseudocercospora fijiensis CIRAD86]EME78768.1 hypothetical protein MYCFIDRAFT_199889 [Pseudocercospora fijiensis CIRAD86]
MHTHTIGYRNKPRLELALYARPKHPNTYHWAIFTAPKSSKGKPSRSVTKRHLLNTLQNIDGVVSQPWRYERISIKDYTSENHLLARIVVGKVLTLNPENDIEQSLGPLPIYQEDDEDQAKANLFGCYAWCRAAVEQLGKDDVVSLKGSWDELELGALKFVEKKKADGRWNGEWKGPAGVPMFDLFTQTEIMA